MKGSSEKKLLLELRQGSPAAFDALYRSYAKRIYSFAWKFLKNREDCEGIVQSVFMKLWEKREQLDENSHLKAYLFRISKNLILNQVKRALFKDVVTHYLEGHHDRYIDPEKEQHYRELVEILDRSIAQLPERRRTIFLLSRNDGLTHKEISERLEISVHTVDTQIRLATRFLREQLDLSR